MGYTHRLWSRFVERWRQREQDKSEKEVHEIQIQILINLPSFFFFRVCFYYI